MKKSGIDQHGQVFEAHHLKGGEIIYYYSDKLHKLYSIANMYGKDLSNRDDLCFCAKSTKYEIIAKRPS